MCVFATPLRCVMTANAWMMASSVLVSIVIATQAVRADRNVTSRDVTNPATNRAPTTARICVSYLSQMGVHMIDVRMLDREANQIWAQYGIAIEGLVAPCNAPGDGPTLKVRVRKIDDV